LSRGSGSSGGVRSCGTLGADRRGGRGVGVSVVEVRHGDGGCGIIVVVRGSRRDVRSAGDNGSVGSGDRACHFALGVQCRVHEFGRAVRCKRRGNVGACVYCAGGLGRPLMIVS
jgi:hypothetical protein